MPINENAILNDVREMLFKEYPTTQISMETFLEYGDGSYLDMTSIEIVQFIVDVEKKYDIIIDIEDRYYTIGDVVHGVAAYLKEKAESEAEEKCESKI